MAYVLPNPFHPWAPTAWRTWLEHQPNGLVENVASVSWVALALIAYAAWRTRTMPDRRWLAFTLLFALMSLGPFIRIAGMNTYLPTPWTFIRYLGPIGSARMPTRMTVLTALGLSMLLAFALRSLRRTSPRPHTFAAIAAALLLVELWPVPRLLGSAAVPEMVKTIATDSRTVRVLNLPLGLRDGLGTRGDYTAISQFYQTVHQKPLVGGYLSRLPAGEVSRYERFPFIHALLDLSEGKQLATARLEAARMAGRGRRKAHNIGWVIVDANRASRELVDFCNSVLDLQFVAADGAWRLYRAEP